MKTTEEIIIALNKVGKVVNHYSYNGYYKEKYACIQIKLKNKVLMAKDLAILNELQPSSIQIYAEDGIYLDINVKVNN